jgi:hypothetical protein
VPEVPKNIEKKLEFPYNEVQRTGELQRDYHRTDSCGPDGAADGWTLEQTMQRNGLVCRPEMALEELEQAMMRSCRCEMERRMVDKLLGNDPTHLPPMEAAHAHCQKCATLVQKMRKEAASIIPPKTSSPVQNARLSADSWLYLRKRLLPLSGPVSGDRDVEDGIDALWQELNMTDPERRMPEETELHSLSRIIFVQRARDLVDMLRTEARINQLKEKMLHLKRRKKGVLSGKAETYRSYALRALQLQSHRS